MTAFYGYDTSNSGAQPSGYDPNNVPGFGGLGNPFGVVGNAYYTAYPSAGYYNWLDTQGLGGSSNAAQYAQGQQTKYYNQYLNYLPYMDPAKNQFLDYLQSSSLSPWMEYSTLGARSQGQSPFMYSPRARWSTPG